MINTELYENVRNVPETAKRKIEAGRLKGKTDINPMWRLKVLTEQFGPCGIGWYYNMTKQWTEQQGDEIAAFVNIELYIKVDDEWSKPIFGTGGSMLAAKERNGIYVSDECYKMALTDAISVACKQLGIGADVYWEKDATKYTSQQETKKTAKESQKQPAPQPNPTAPQENTTQRDIAVLRNTLQGKGIDEAFVCKLYKIESIDKVTANQYSNILKHLDDIKKKQEETQ